MHLNSEAFIDQQQRIICRETYESPDYDEFRDTYDQIAEDRLNEIKEIFSTNNEIIMFFSEIATLALKKDALTDEDYQQLTDCYENISAIKNTKLWRAHVPFKYPLPTEINSNVRE